MTSLFLSNKVISNFALSSTNSDQFFCCFRLLLFYHMPDLLSYFHCFQIQLFLKRTAGLLISIPPPLAVFTFSIFQTGACGYGRISPQFDFIIFQGVYFHSRKPFSEREWNFKALFLSLSFVLLSLFPGSIRIILVKYKKKW